MLDQPAFTAFQLDRADALRRDDAALDALWLRADARAVPFWRLRPLVRDEGAGDGGSGRAPAWTAPAALATERAGAVFLGLDADGAPRFALALEPAAEPDASRFAGARFEELREAAPLMTPEDGSILGAARAVLAWHESHPFCSRCGERSAPALGGWKRLCPACSAEHFPRTDPVVIMLIVRGDLALLGRGVAWPENRFSCLAGFVEPGETVADAARREAREETGVVLGEVSFLTSQPWPFPSSLMLGLCAEALTEQITVDPHELADARWLPREDVAALVAGTHPTLKGPPPFAVAHHLLRWWGET